MSFPRALRVTAFSAVLAMGLGAVTSTAAHAGRPAPKPTGLAADVTPHPGDTYDVAASWNATPTATSYRVSLTRGSTTFSSATVKGTTWSPTVTATPGSASLNVRAVVGKKPGRTATITVPLADVTGPAGSFHATWDNNTGVAQLAVVTPASDDSGGPVTASVNWDDGSLPEPWSMTAPLNHSYPPATEARYVPKVTLTDSSSNHTVVALNAVVIDDSEQPTGAYNAGPSTAWATLDKVTLTQTALNDNWSPNAHITRTVDWGDDTTPQSWAPGTTTLLHTYAKAGDFTPAVTLTDESGNAAVVVSTTSVTVKVDSTGPVVRFVLPKSKHSVRAFRTLKGKATDTGGTGVAKVNVKAVEKRGAAWYGYNAKTKRWLKAGSKAKAYGRARAMVTTTGARHVWTVKLSGLRKGTLVYKAFAKDKVANKSAIVSHRATLTRR